MSSPRPNPRKPLSTPLCAIVVALLLAGCGGSSASSKSTAASGAKPSSAVRSAGLQRLSEFAACMRAHGVKLPAPNGSGKGPVFDTTGIDLHAAAYKSANTLCVHTLLQGTVHPGHLHGPGAGKQIKPPISLE